MSWCEIKEKQRGKIYITQSIKNIKTENNLLHSRNKNTDFPYQFYKTSLQKSLQKLDDRNFHYL